jgi:hypothetical protein
MNTYEITDKDGTAFAFENENVYITPRKIAKLFTSTGGVTKVRIRKLLDSGNENRLEFEYLGGNFVVWEPYGDNSRYWIGPKDAKERLPQIAAIERIFEKYKPPRLVKFIGNLISLNFRAMFRS